LNSGAIGFGFPSFTCSSIIRKGIPLRSAMMEDFRSEELEPSDEVDTITVFNVVINNNACAWTEIKDEIGEDFAFPQKNPIFYVDYEGQHDSYIANQIMKHRIIPMIRRAKVQPSTILRFVALIST
jgi:hypothetical protein